MLKHFLISILLLSSAFTVFSQDQQRRFGTQKYMRSIQLTDSTYSKKRGEIEEKILDFKYYGSMDTFEIPVVFHILYTDQSPISAEDLEAQLARLNTDFFAPVTPYVSNDEYRFTKAEDNLTYLHPADQKEGFASRTAVPMVKFCFPQFDPQGDSTDGVIYLPNSKKYWGINDSLKRNDLGGSAPWDPVHYCNIWVTSLLDSMAGFAQMPGGALATDGIVIDQKYFLRADGSVPAEASGNDFALGRTLVHLMGSYLGVFELWNEDTPCGDDFVEDTPIHNAPNYGKNEYRHVTTCEGNAVEMTMNLMDSGCDSTMYMFTWGQVARMQAVLHHYRQGLKTTVTGCADQLNKSEERAAFKSPEAGRSLSVRAVPNPNSGNFTVEIQAGEFPAGEALIQIFNASGSLVMEKKVDIISGSIVRVPVSGYDWPGGIYSVRVSTGREIQVQQVILNH